MKMEIELPKDGLPSDRQVDSLRYGIPKKGDWILRAGDVWEQVVLSYERCKFPIAVLKPKETWVPATVQDAIDALSGKVVECRGVEGGTQMTGFLVGYSPGTLFPWAVRVSGIGRHGVDCFSECLVLRETP